MQRIRGMVAGFVAGVACATGAFLLMRDTGGAPTGADSARIADLGEQVRLLEQSVSRLSTLVAANAGGHGVAPPSSAAATPEPAPAPGPTPAQAEAVAAADAVVDRGLQSGRWTRAQANELSDALAEVDAKEGARILARLTAAINRDELQLELP